MPMSHAIVEWQEEGSPIGIIPLRSILEPRKEFHAYKEEDIVQARCFGYQGRYPAKLLKLGESVKDLKKVQEELTRTPKESTKKSKETIQQKQKKTPPNQEKTTRKHVVDHKEKENIRKKKFQERRVEAQHRREARRIRMEELEKLFLENEASTGTTSMHEDTPVPDDISDNEVPEDNITVHLDATSTPGSISPPIMTISGSDSDMSEEDPTPIDKDIHMEVNAKGYPTAAMKVPRQQAIQDTNCHKCHQFEIKYKEEMKKVDVLKCKLAEALKEIQSLKNQKTEEDFIAGHALAVPKPGILSRDIATKYKMVELTSSSSVYLYPHDLDEVRKAKDMATIGTVAHGCRMAKLLMNKFWRKGELVGATISTDGCPSKTVLNQQIIKAIKAYCVSNSDATPGKIRQAMASKVTSVNAKERRAHSIAGKRKIDD